MDCPLSGHSQPACHPSPGFLGSREVILQQCNFISAPQSDVTDGCLWEPADQNWVSRTTVCVQCSSCWRMWCKEWSLNQSESHRCRAFHFLSTPHSLPPVPASPQAQFFLWWKMDRPDFLHDPSCPVEFRWLFLFNYCLIIIGASLVAQTVKCLPAMSGDQGSIPGSRRSPGEGNGNPLQ